MIAIRPITLSDVPAFRAVLDGVCRERRFLAMLEAPPLDEVKKFVARSVEHDWPQFVAAEHGAILGWCDAIPGEAAVGNGHIGRLGMGVDRAHRGQGIGRRLVTATIAKARTRGLEKIELSVYASNLPAIALYRKLEFVEEGRRIRGRLVDGQYDDVILMGFDLKTAAPTSAKPDLQKYPRSTWG